jgi:hypothetical protein
VFPSVRFGSSGDGQGTAAPQELSSIFREEILVAISTDQTTAPPYLRWGYSEVSVAATVSRASGTRAIMVVRMARTDEAWGHIRRSSASEWRRADEG